jgi:hypothetical protein
MKKWCRMVRTVIASSSVVPATFMSAVLLPATHASAAALEPALEGIRWAEGSDELARRFGSRAIRLLAATPQEYRTRFGSWGFAFYGSSHFRENAACRRLLP